MRRLRSNYMLQAFSFEMCCGELPRVLVQGPMQRKFWEHLRIGRFQLELCVGVVELNCGGGGLPTQVEERGRRGRRSSFDVALSVFGVL